MAGVTVPVRFSGDADDVFDDFEREADSAGRRASRKLGKGISDGADDGGKKARGSLRDVFAGSFLADIASSAFQGIVEGFVDVTKEAIEASDATDKFKQTLKFAGLDDKKIADLAKSTKAYADQTVFSLGDIQSITAQLAANGVKDYDVLAMALGNLNAVVGGNAETFKRVGSVLTQTAGAGKLTTENWNQLSEAIPGAAGKLQEALRKSGAFTGNFREAMEKGEISAEEFAEAIKTLGLTDQAKEAATSTKTIEGALGNLRATLVSGLMSAIDQIKPQLTQLINGLSGLFGGLFSLFEQAAPHLQQFAAGLTSAGTQSAPFFNALKTVAVPAFQTLGTAVATIAAQVLPMLQQAFATLAPKFQELAIAIFPLVEAISHQLVPAFNAIKPIVQTVFSAVTTIIGTAIDVIIQIVKFFTAVFKGDWEGALKAFVEGMNASWKLILEIVKGAGKLLLEAVKLLFGNLINKVKTDLGNVKKAFSDAWNSVVSTAKSILAGVGKAVADTVATAKSTAVTALGNVKQAFSDAWNSVVSTATTTLAGIGKAVSDSAQTAYDNITGLPARLAGVFSGSSLYQAGFNLIGTLVDGIARRIGDAVQAVKDGLARIGGMLPGSPIKTGPLVSWNNGGAGEKLMDFLAQGITSGAPLVTGAMDNAASALAVAPQRAVTSTPNTTVTSAPTVVFNEYGPTSGSGKVAELEWAMKYSARAYGSTLAGVTA